MITIDFHGCPSPYQDSRYGLNQRLFNTLASYTPKDRKQRCTVCGQPLQKKLVDIKSSASQIQQMGGLPLKQGAWTCMGVV